MSKQQENTQRGEGNVPIAEPAQPQPPSQPAQPAPAPHRKTFEERKRESEMFLDKNYKAIIRDLPEQLLLANYRVMQPQLTGKPEHDRPAKAHEGLVRYFHGVAKIEDLLNEERARAVYETVAEDIRKALKGISDIPDKYRDMFAKATLYALAHDLRNMFEIQKRLMRDAEKRFEAEFKGKDGKPDRKRQIRYAYETIEEIYRKNPAEGRHLVSKLVQEAERGGAYSEEDD